MSTEVFRKYSAFERDKSMRTHPTNDDLDIVVINVRDYKKISYQKFGASRREKRIAGNGNVNEGMKIVRSGRKLSTL